jgi:hypothetical protein
MKKDVPENIDSVLLPEKIKSKRWIIAIWSDPILGGLFVSGIMIIPTLLFSIIKSLICNISVQAILKEILNYEIPVYFILIFAIFIWILIILNKRYGKSKIKRKLNKLYDTKIGDFTFFDLHNLLLNHQIKNPHRYKRKDFEKGNLLFYLVMFSRKFNVGIPDDISDEILDYLYWTIGSILISYDLVEIKETTELGIKKEMMYLTQNGKRFMRYYYLYHYYIAEKYNDW